MQINLKQNGWWKKKEGEEKKEEVSAEKEEGYIDPKLEEEYIFLAGHV